MERLLAIYIPILDGMPIIVAAIAIAFGVAVGQVLVLSFMRRQQAKNVRAARENGQLGQNGIVVSTYSKWGAFRKGYLLVDENAVILQDKNKKVLRKMKRSEIASVNYVASIMHNYALIFNLQDGTSERVFTFRPDAAGNPFIAEAINELGATALTKSKS